MDLIGTLPFQLFELINSDESSQELGMTKIARIPRIYRIIRILRLIKLFRLRRKNRSVSNIFRRLANVNPNALNMFRLGFMVLILTHIVACAWFLQA